MNILANVLGTIIKQVAKRNKKNDNVKTADPVVFDEVQKKIENVDHGAETSRSRADVLRDYFEKVKEAQVENEASPEVETADRSVYEDMLKQIEELKAKVEHQNRQPNIPMPDVQVNQAPQIMQAWNSSGGTLEGRSAPDMAAQKSTLRIPNGGVFNVLEYSENGINLDGKRSRFVLVESNGQKAWVLENYLNFN